MGNGNWSGRWSRRRWAGLALAAGLIAGCGGGGGTSDGGGGSSSGGVTPPDLSGPVIGDSRALPAALHFTGGYVQIGATVTDQSAITAVWAEIAHPDGTRQTAPLTASGSSYSATWSAPANAAGGAQRAYTVVIYARDSAGNQSATAPLTVTVAAVELPPVPPQP